MGITMSSPKSQLVMIKSMAGVKKLIDFCKKTRYASIDFETNGESFGVEDSYPTILGVCFQPGCSYIIPLGHFDSPFTKDEYVNILKLFGREVIQNPIVTKIAWNIKFEMSWFMKYGIDFRGRCFDGMLAKYLLDEERPNDLKSQVSRFIPDFGGYEEESEPGVAWDKKSLSPLSKYCGLDCDLTFRLTLWFENLLIKRGFYPLYRNLIMMMTRALQEIEFNGMIINGDYLKNYLDPKYTKLIKESTDKMMSHKLIKRFEKDLQKSRIMKMVDKLKNEISELEESHQNPYKMIASREEKIQRLLTRDFRTKSELEILNPFNLDSVQQMVMFLYTSDYGLSLPVIEYTKSKDKRPTNNPSTKAETIEKLVKIIDDPEKKDWLNELIKLRQLNTLYSTFILGSIEKITPLSRLHTSYKIHGTVTGRLSSENPNLQNIPRVTTNPDIKKMIVPPPGYFFVELDYAQAELRIVAELAGEEELIRYFNEGKSVHVAVACKANGRANDYDEIYKITKDESHPEYPFWTKQKKRAKTISFGILYEQGDQMLAETLKCTKEEAAEFKKQWFRDFPKIEKWVKGQHNKVRKYKHVYSLFGRKRRLYSIDDERKWVAMEAQRQSVNTPIQSASSDFTQLTLIEIRERRLLGYFPSYLIPLATVHDSIEYPMKPEDIQYIIPKIIEIGQDPDTEKWFGFKLKRVKMKLSYELGLNWGEMHEPKLKETDFNLLYRDLSYKQQNKEVKQVKKLKKRWQK